MLNCWKIEPEDRPATNELIPFFEAYKDEMCPYQGLIKTQQYRSFFFEISISILALINIVGKNDNVTVIKGPKMNHVVDLLDKETKEILLEESVLIEMPTKGRDSLGAHSIIE